MEILLVLLFLAPVIERTETVFALALVRGREKQVEPGAFASSVISRDLLIVGKLVHIFEVKVHDFL